MTDRADIANLAENLKTTFIGFQLAVPIMVHPEVPLIQFHRSMGIPPDSPAIIKRNDGTVHSDESIGSILNRMAGLPGAGLEGELLAVIGIHGAVRLGDELLNACLIRPEEPLLEFARHLRNACAHGNRWHFRNGEPKHPAQLRDRELDLSLHGTKAMYGWLGPGDYLDYLDDLTAYLRG